MSKRVSRDGDGAWDKCAPQTNTFILSNFFSVNNFLKMNQVTV